MLGLTLAILAQAAAAASAPSAASAPAEDKLICRKYDVIGSLVKKTKVCRTKAEWVRIRATMDDEVERLKGPNPGNQPG